MTHTTWCRRQARDNAKEHVDCSNCQCHSGEQFTCPVCGHGSGRPTAVDLEWIDGKHLPQKETSEELAVRLRQTSLVRNPNGIPWVEICPACEKGKPRCKTCGRVVSWWATTENNCHSCHRKSRGLKPRAPDSQKQKVYDMEYRVFRKAYSRNVTVAEAKKILQRLSRKFHTTVPRLENLPGRAWTRAGDYRNNRIRLSGASRNMVCVGTVIHEYAHHLKEQVRLDGPAHGPSYVRTLYECMWTMGYAEDRPSQARWKVRIMKASAFWDRVKAIL